MQTIKITLENKDGRIIYVDSQEEIRKIIPSLPKNINWKRGAKSADLSRKYFLMVTELNKAINSGYTKSDLHEALKPMIMYKLRDNINYFKEGVFVASTQALTHDGWVAYIEQFKVVCNDTFNYIFT